MSESTVAAPAVTEAAPAPAPAPEVTPQAPPAATPPVEQPTQVTATGPAARREARAQMHAARTERAAAEAQVAPTDAAPAVPTTTGAPAPTIDALGRAHAPAGTDIAGQFLPAGQTATGVETGATPQETPPAVADTAAGNEPPAGMVRVPIPDTLKRYCGNVPHADVPASLEQIVRFSLNNAVRVDDVTQLQQQVKQYAEQYNTLYQQALRLHAENEARSNWQGQALSDGTIAKYQAIHEADPEAAELFLAGAYAKLNQDVDRRYGETLEQEQTRLQGEYDQQQAQQAQQWILGAREEAVQRWDRSITSLHNFDDIFADATASYVREVQRKEAAGQPQTFDSERLVGHHLKAALMADEGVQQILRQRRASSLAGAEAARQAETDGIRTEAAESARRQAVAEAEAAEKARFEAAGRRAPPNPVGAINGAIRTGVNSTTPETTDTSRMSPGELKRSLRAQLPALVQRHVRA